MLVWGVQTKFILSYYVLFQWCLRGSFEHINCFLTIAELFSWLLKVYVGPTIKLDHLVNCSSFVVNIKDLITDEIRPDSEILPTSLWGLGMCFPVCTGFWLSTNLKIARQLYQWKPYFSQKKPLSDFFFYRISSRSAGFHLNV